jgi:saccharopine dehydrogenase (NAD+, L-lysine-forming)
VSISAFTISRSGYKGNVPSAHEEIEALDKHYPEIKRIRFFMTFGQSYLTHMKCLENVGMLSTVPSIFRGRRSCPFSFSRRCCPIPRRSAPARRQNEHRLRDHGRKGRQGEDIFIYNVCDHEECYRELGSQAISYTTGVPAMIGAALVLNGTWKSRRVTTDEFDPDPYMDMLNKWGLPWVVDEHPVTVE